MLNTSFVVHSVQLLLVFLLQRSSLQLHGRRDQSTLWAPLLRGQEHSTGHLGRSGSGSGSGSDHIYLKLLQLAISAMFDNLPEDGPGNIAVLALGLKSQSHSAVTLCKGFKLLPAQEN